MSQSQDHQEIESEKQEERDQDQVPNIQSTITQNLTLHIAKIAEKTVLA